MDKTNCWQKQCSLMKISFGINLGEFVLNTSTKKNYFKLFKLEFKTKTFSINIYILKFTFMSNKTSKNCFDKHLILNITFISNLKLLAWNISEQLWVYNIFHSFHPFHFLKTLISKHLHVRYLHIRFHILSYNVFREIVMKMWFWKAYPMLQSFKTLFFKCV